MTGSDKPIPIVKGITMTLSGEVTIDPALDEPLCDLAIALQGPDDLPVDIEHIVAALILASRAGQIPSDYELKPRDRSLKAILKTHVRTIFQRYGGQVCDEDDMERDDATIDGELTDGELTDGELTDGEFTDSEE